MRFVYVLQDFGGRRARRPRIIVYDPSVSLQNPALQQQLLQLKEASKKYSKNLTNPPRTLSKSLAFGLGGGDGGGGGGLSHFSKLPEKTAPSKNAYVKKKQVAYKAKKQSYKKDRVRREDRSKKEYKYAPFAVSQSLRVIFCLLLVPMLPPYSATRVLFL